MNERTSAIMEQKEPASVGVSFPLLWLLIPQILAYVFCGNAWWSALFPLSRFFFAGLLFFAISVSACIYESFFEERSSVRFASGIWKLCFPIAAFFIFCAWWTLRAPPTENWGGKSPREVEIELRIEKSFLTSNKKIYGFARIENVSEKANIALLTGARIWYSFPRSIFDDAETEVREGSVFRAVGVMSSLSPGPFLDQDFLDFLQRERVSAIFNRATSVDAISTEHSFVACFFANAKHSFRETIISISAGEEGRQFRAGRIFGAMFLGDRSLLTAEQKENFLFTGTMHIFAVSGLHISILAGGFLVVMRLVRLPRIPAWLIMLGVLWFYVRIIGAPPSAMRAWLMLVFIFLGSMLGRGRKSFHGLLFSAFIALMINPFILGNAGFQLSYFVVTAILLYGVPAIEILDRVTNFNRWHPIYTLSLPRKIAARVKRALISSGCISFSAFLAGTPSIIGLFGFCSFLVLLANLALVPLVAVSAWIGAAAVLVAYIPIVGTFLGKWIFSVAAILLSIVDYVAEVLSEIPAVAKLSFPRRELDVVGGVLLLLIFFFGAIRPELRERPWLRFVLPPLFLSLYLLVFAY